MVCFYLEQRIRAQYLDCVGPSPAHEADTYSADSLAGMDESRCSHSMAQPVDQCAPSRQYKPTSSPDPIVHSELES